MFLWKSIAYGPVFSRRLGHSLGLNVLPRVRKLCNFNCVYCECGLNDKRAPKEPLPTPEEFDAELCATLADLAARGQPLDNLTFAGNGEPTLHPQFLEIIRRTREARDAYYPGAEIAVLTDAAALHQKNVMEALQLADKPILKIDAGSEEMFRLIDQPERGVALWKIVERMKAFGGNLYVQTLFLRGEVEGNRIDNTTDEELELMIGHYRAVHPVFVMVYSIDREPPYATLETVGRPELERIAERIRAAGIDAECYG